MKSAGLGAAVALLLAPTFATAQRQEHPTPLRVSISELGLAWALLGERGDLPHRQHREPRQHAVRGVLRRQRTRRAGEAADRNIALDGRTHAVHERVADAHNAIAIAVDGSGVLHVAWAEHNRALHYARAVRAGSLALGPVEQMTGRREERVTYPQLYSLPRGDLLFVYRDGQSGRGDVLLDRYDVRTREWRVLQHPLIAGEGHRNAYVNQLAIDERGGWHLSWVWRDSPDVATNHDLLYAYSPDEGRSWRRSTGDGYAVPITRAPPTTSGRPPVCGRSRWGSGSRPTTSIGGGASDVFHCSSSASARATAKRWRTSGRNGPR